MRKRWLVGMLVLLVLMNIVSGCHSEKTIEDKLQYTDSCEELITEFSGEKEDTDQDEEKTETESEVTAPTSLKESVAESMRAELEYSLPKEEFSEIAEMLREMETDRRAGDFKLKRTLAPGNLYFGYMRIFPMTHCSFIGNRIILCGRKVVRSFIDCMVKVKRDIAFM